MLLFFFFFPGVFFCSKATYALYRFSISTYSCQGRRVIRERMEHEVPLKDALL